jgi:predicted double-glycine peptidase
MNQLIIGVPFYPDDTFLCGPASLAAVLTYNGYPTEIKDVQDSVHRWNLRGAIGADLALYAREKGAKASFFSSSPEELLKYIDSQKPVLVEVDNGIGPISKPHFMVVVGYSHDGVVANNGLIQQEIIPWSKFLTAWFKMGYFALVVEKAPEDVK